MTQDHLAVAQEQARAEQRCGLNLSRSIQSVAEVEGMETTALETHLAAHEWEIVRLVGALETHKDDPKWAVRARQAERTLRLHKSWIERELKLRRNVRAMAAAVEAKQARGEAHRLMLEKAQADKVARISASNDENMRQLAIFKAVARETLGAEKYLHLWTLVRQRMEATGEKA